MRLTMCCLKHDGSKLKECQSFPSSTISLVDLEGASTRSGQWRRGSCPLTQYRYNAIGRVIEVSEFIHGRAFCCNENAVRFGWRVNTIVKDDPDGVGTGVVKKSSTITTPLAVVETATVSLDGIADGNYDLRL